MFGNWYFDATYSLITNYPIGNEDVAFNNMTFLSYLTPDHPITRCFYLFIFSYPISSLLSISLIKIFWIYRVIRWQTSTIPLFIRSTADTRYIFYRVSSGVIGCHRVPKHTNTTSSTAWTNFVKKYIFIFLTFRKKVFIPKGLFELHMFKTDFHYLLLLLAAAPCFGPAYYYLKRLFFGNASLNPTLLRSKEGWDSTCNKEPLEKMRNANAKKPKLPKPISRDRDW